MRPHSASVFSTIRIVPRAQGENHYIGYSARKLFDYGENRMNGKVKKLSLQN
jgi:hypothetical protein